MVNNKNENDEFEMTSDEVNRIGKALKDKQFHDLLVEYANEISDPVNKKKYEEDIISMERQRGQVVRFLKPQGGFVVKTCRLSDNKKTFINICTSPDVEEFSMKAGNQNGTSGSHVALPHSVTPGRDDFDKAGKSCVVYDVCFHPKTYDRMMKDERHRHLLIETAFDTLEKQTEKVDRLNKKFPKMKYKGTPQAAIIRENQANKQSLDQNNKRSSDFDFPYPELSTKTIDIEKSFDVNGNKDSLPYTANEKTTCSPDRVTPKYSVIHRGYFDMQDFLHERESTTNIPKELVIEIELPLAKSASEIDLDIFEKQLVLDSEKPAYHLNISLPYKVNEDNGRAQFDKAKKILTVTLPVQKPELSPKCLGSESIYVQELASLEAIKSNICNGNIDLQSSDVSVETLVSQEKTDTIIEESIAELQESVPLSQNLNFSESRKSDKAPEGNLSHSKSESTSQAESQQITNGSDAAVDTQPYIDFDLVTFDTALLESLPGNSKLPPYSYDQSLEKICVEVKVSNVKIAHLSLGFTTQQVCLSFPQDPEERFSPDWSLVIRLAEGNYLNKDECSFDLHEDSLELYLKKREPGLWDKFFVGVSEITLKPEFFMTDTVASEILKEMRDKKSHPANLSKEDNANITALKVESRLQQLLNEQDRESKQNHYEELVASLQTEGIFDVKKDVNQQEGEKSEFSGSDNNGLSSVASTTSDFSDEDRNDDDDDDDDLSTNLNLLDLQDDVITDSSPLSSPVNQLEYNRSLSHEDSRRKLLRSILKRSKSDGGKCDTDEDYSYSRTRACTLSDGCFSSAKKNPFGRRRNKSVTFSEEPLVFEFTKFSKRQWKRMEKNEKNKESKNENVKEVTQTFKKETSDESDSSKYMENTKHGKKWKKKERRRLRKSESRSDEECEHSKSTKMARKKKIKNKVMNSNDPKSFSIESEFSSRANDKPELNNSLIFELE